MSKPTAKGCAILAIQFIGAWIIFGVFMLGVVFMEAPIKHGVIIPVKQALSRWEAYWGGER